MRKAICLLLILLISCLFLLPVLAAAQAPVITLQPQSYNYPEYSVAIFTVKASGTNLSATWYMEWQGKTYPISDIGGTAQPWEGYAGETYGARKLDDNTFAYIFGGIGSELYGASIWCVIEDGHYDVTSQKARISVGNSNMPPEILSIPSQLTVEQGSEAEIRCVAKSPDGSQLSFLWYETDTGRLEDIRAVNRGTEAGDFLFCDTSIPGTRNYLCMVKTDKGGLVYSSQVKVTVTEKAPQTQPTTQATSPTEQTQPSTAPDSTQPSTAPQSTTAPSQGSSSNPTEPTQPTQQPTQSEPQKDTDEGVPGWALILIGVGAAGIGVGVAVLLVKKRS